MKIKGDFVTNSSSSSFVINKSDLTDEQMAQIRNHSNVLPTIVWMNSVYVPDAWEIIETSQKISGRTVMDNFNMGEYLIETVGVEPNKIIWDDGWSIYNEDED